MKAPVQTTQILFFTTFLALFLHIDAFAQKGLPMVRKPIIHGRRMYDPRIQLYKNTVRIQALQVFQSARFTYERLLHFHFSAGINASYQYSGQESGTTKAELFAKYHVSQDAPTGFYFYGSYGLAQVKNHAFKYLMTDTEGGKEITFDPNRPYAISEAASFSTRIGNVGLGYQKNVGLDERISIDVGASYQFCQLPTQYRKTITANDLVYGKFDANRRILGPISPIALRFGIGYCF